MKFLHKLFFFLIGFSILNFNGQAQTNTSSGDNWIAITNVNVLPMNKETILKNQTVLIKNGKIESISNAKKTKLPANAQIIKAKGKYLMPGISEMHAHIPIPKDGNDENVRETLFLYLSNGITTIRGMLGNPYHLELKAQVAKEQILSPRVYTSSPSMNGNSVKSIEIAEEKVRQYKKDGFDFLKLHPGLSLAIFDKIVETSKEVGMTYSGHVSTGVGVHHSIESNYASIDHLDGYIEGLVPASANVDPSENGFFGFNFTDLADKSAIPSIAKKTKKNNVWVVPTQSLMVHMASSMDGNVLAARDEMKYVSAKTRYAWRNSKQQIANDPEFDVDKSNRFLAIRDEILLELHKAGVGILLGSDAPQVFNVPGFSIQHEMKSMANAGMSNYEILKSGTINPAQFFKAEGQYGVIAKNASADLILLHENPLKSIENMSKIEGVMVRGKWLSRAFLDERLEQIAKKYGE